MGKCNQPSSCDLLSTIRLLDISYKVLSTGWFKIPCAYVRSNFEVIKKPLVLGGSRNFVYHMCYLERVCQQGVGLHPSISNIYCT